MRHIIKKQFIELELDKKLDHFRLQQLVSQHYWEVIVPLLEKELDKIGNEDEIIEIDRLEIDLGLLSQKSIEKNEWSNQLTSKLEEILQRAIANASVHTVAVRTSKRLSVFRQWLFYMQKGYLPWNTATISEEWYQLTLETLAVDFESVQLLRNEIHSSYSVLKRIVFQHDEHFLLKLAEILTASKQNDLIETIDELVILSLYLQKQTKPVDVYNVDQIKVSIWERAILLAASPAASAAKRKLAKRIVSLFAEENKIEKKLPEEISSQIPVILPSVRNAIESADEEILKAKEKFVEDKDKQLADERTIDEEGIFIVNAGVVLLHPFLNKLFARLDLVDRGAFKDQHAHQTALYVLHYLATGKTEAEEHELVIAKIICAYPLDEPVEKAIQIDDRIRKESDEMLEAAIGQWDMLKNTTPAGLREGFLQRNGKLFSRNENLYLYVEKNAIDILLDYLPWNLSMVRLPWRKDILRVEWR